MTGIAKAERNVVRTTVTEAGGRYGQDYISWFVGVSRSYSVARKITPTAVAICSYSPTFNRRCTHLLVASDLACSSSVKLSLAHTNSQKWHTKVVDVRWLAACVEQNQALAVELFPPCYASDPQATATAGRPPLKVASPNKGQLGVPASSTKVPTCLPLLAAGDQSAPCSCVEYVTARAPQDGF